MRLAACRALPLLLTLSLPCRGAAFPEFRVDPRIELLAALHVLADEQGELPGFRWNETAYAAALRVRVEPLRAHRAVALYLRAYRRAARRGWGYMGVLNAVLPCLSESLASSTQGACASNALAPAAADFALQARFAAFLSEQSSLLRGYEAQLEAQSRGLDPKGAYEDFTGLKAAAAHRVSPSPLLSPGQVWNRLEPGEPPSILTVLSPTLENGAAAFEYAPLLWDLWHEQSHALLDGELEAHAGRVARLEPVLASVAGLCYVTWRQCLKEHMAQGLARGVALWARDTGRLSPPPRPLKETLPYLGQVADRLKEFDAQRAKYPTIRQFYPRLLDVFDELPRSTAAARGAPPRPPETAAARAFKARGLEHFKARRLPQALDAFAQAAQADPQDAEAALDRAIVLVELKGPEEALKDLDLAVAAARRQSEDVSDYLLADALSSRAAALEDLGRLAEARRDTEEALLVAPDDWSRAEEARRSLEPRP